MEKARTKSPTLMVWPSARHSDPESQFLHLSNGVAVLTGVSGWRVSGVMVGRTAHGFVVPASSLHLVLAPALTTRQKGAGSVPSRDQETAE